MFKALKIGSLVKFELVYVSKCCGTNLEGYFYGEDEAYIYLSNYATLSDKQGMDKESAIRAYPESHEEVCIFI